MRSETMISQIEGLMSSARVSSQRCLGAYAITAKWFDVATGDKHAAINPAHGPGGSS